MLEQKGYTQLYNIRGGIAAWADLLPEIGRY
jgi:rhodanese-related sulfurtransferase